MFHCNGWTYTWAVTAAGGTHVCLRKVDPAVIFPTVRDEGVTVMCGAPVVLTMLIHAPESVKCRFPQAVDMATGGAAPPSAVIAAMERMGFRVKHLYGLTETYGPSAVCVPQPEWEGLPQAERAAVMARQGVRLPTMREPEGGRGRDVRAGTGGREDAGRADAPRQHGDEGLPQEPLGDRGGVPGRAGSTPATSR